MLFRESVRSLSKEVVLVASEVARWINNESMMERVMRKNAIWSVMVLVGCVSLMGCNDELNEEDSRQAWAATQAVLGQGGAGASGTGGGPDGKADGAGSLSFTFPCEGGQGSATFSSTALFSSGLFGFDYTVSFDKCASQGTFINGSLNYVGELNSSGLSVSYAFTYDGLLEYTGEVKGSCTVDMQGTSSAGLLDNTLTAQINYTGSVCGHDASKTLNASVTF